jgi:hypothetical protein
LHCSRGGGFDEIGFQFIEFRVQGGFVIEIVIAPIEWKSLARDIFNSGSRADHFNPGPRGGHQDHNLMTQSRPGEQLVTNIGFYAAAEGE